MIKKMDAYIIKKYFSTFFFVVLIMTMIAVVFNFGEMIERLIESGLPWMTILSDYYLPFIPWINSMLWPLFALITVIFFTSRLAKNSEILPFFNAGVSYYRFLMPFLLAASTLTVVYLFGNHYFLPLTSKTRLDFFNTYISRGKEVGKNRKIHLFLSPESKAFVGYYNKKDSVGHHFRLETFKEGRMTSILKANRIELIAPPDRWRLNNYEQRILNKSGHELSIHKQTNLDTTLQLYHEDFVRYSNENDMLTTFQLLDFMETEKKRGLGNIKSMSVALHKRSSEPFSLIILTIIGVAIASRKTRGGMGLNIAVSMILGAVYIVVSKFGETLSLGENFPVALGIWLPNIIFGVVAIFLIQRAQK